MDPKTIKSAVISAEKEIEEKNIERIKLIAKSYLEKINEKTKERSKLDSEIKDLKKDLDDLKSGRLDKIEERQALDPAAKGHSLVIIKKVVEHYYPTKPWYSQYEIVIPQNPYYYSSPTGTITTSTGSWDTRSLGQRDALNAFFSLNSSSPQENVFNAVGTAFQNFVSGTYKLNNGDVVNL